MRISEIMQSALAILTLLLGQFGGMALLLLALLGMLGLLAYVVVHLIGALKASVGTVQQLPQLASQLTAAEESRMRGYDALV